MIAAPYYLMSLGVVVIIVGLILTGLSRPAGNPASMIDPRMRDDEIAEQLNRREGPIVPYLVVMAGGLLLLVSIVWRIARFFF